MRSFQAIPSGPARTVCCAWQAASKGTWWTQHREASLNWLALGLLLAAWNASDDGSAAHARRPPGLRGYPFVSVRAATCAVPKNRDPGEICRQSHESVTVL